MRLIWISIVFIFVPNSFAQDWHFSPFFGFDGQYTFIKADDESFNPANGRFRFGLYFYQSLAIEASYGIPMHDDSQYNVDVSIEKSYSFNLRWESPPEHYDGFSVYFLTGYAINRLNIENQAGYPGKQDYKGFNIGLGFKQRYFNLASLYLEYNYQYAKDDLQIRGLSLGAQIEF